MTTREMSFLNVFHLKPLLEFETEHRLKHKLDLQMSSTHLIKNTQIASKNKCQPDPVAHACDSSTLGG